MSQPLAEFIGSRAAKMLNLADDVRFALGLRRDATPACTATHRGGMSRIDGASGAADRVKVCGKNAAGVYADRDLAFEDDATAFVRAYTSVAPTCENADTSTGAKAAQTLSRSLPPGTWACMVGASLSGHATVAGAVEFRISGPCAMGTWAAIGGEASASGTTGLKAVGHTHGLPTNTGDKGILHNHPLDSGGASASASPMEVTHAHTLPAQTGDGSVRHDHLLSGSTGDHNASHGHAVTGGTAGATNDHKHYIKFLATDGQTGGLHSHQVGGNTARVSGHLHGIDRPTSDHSGHKHAVEGYTLSNNNAASESTLHDHGAGTLRADVQGVLHSHSMPSTTELATVATTTHKHDIGGTTGETTAGQTRHQHGITGVTGNVTAADTLHSHGIGGATGAADPSTSHDHNIPSMAVRDRSGMTVWQLCEGLSGNVTFRSEFRQTEGGTANCANADISAVCYRSS